MRRALGHPAVVAPEGRPVRAARHRHDPGDRQRRHRLRDPRPHRRRPDRDHHLPRLRRRVVGAAAVRRARRARRHLPRSPPARAAADVRPAAHRRRLRGRQGRRDRRRSCSRSRSCRRSCCSSATCSSATARSTTSPATSTCCGRCRSRSRCSPCTTPSIGVAISSLTDRRIVAGRVVIGLFLVTSISSAIIVGDPALDGGSAAALINVLAPAAVPARPRVPRPHRPRSTRSAA